MAGSALPADTWKFARVDCCAIERAEAESQRPSIWWDIHSLAHACPWTHRTCGLSTDHFSSRWASMNCTRLTRSQRIVRLRHGQSYRAKRPRAKRTRSPLLPSRLPTICSRQGQSQWHPSRPSSSSTPGHPRNPIHLVSPLAPICHLCLSTFHGRGA